MLTNLPMRPRSLYSTTPVTFANRVSSLPQPTLRPALILVPRCRTITEPPGTNCPPKTLTPSRCEFESRPFLELPNPFLCAIPHLCRDVAHLHFGEGLAMPDGFLILLLALELEHQNLVAAAVADDRAFHRGAGNHLARVAKRGLNGELDFRPDIAGDLFHADDVARSYPVLFSARFDNRVHRKCLVWEPEHTKCAGTAGVNFKFTTNLNEAESGRKSSGNHESSAV